jgi:hypothetical protein
VSPRSTVIPVIGAEVVRMTQSGAEDDGSSNVKATHASAAEGEPNGGKNHEGNKTSPQANQVANRIDKAGEGGLSPSPHHMQAGSYLQGYPAHLTPQPGQGYYYQQSQITPEPPSPAGPGAVVYDVGSFFQQPAAFAPHNSPFVPQTPLSPRRTAGMGGIPPASPLFPRVNTTGAAGLMPAGAGIEHRIMEGHRVGAPPSPSVSYLSPPLGPNSIYQSYGSDSPEDISAAWGDRYGNNVYLYYLLCARYLILPIGSELFCLNAETSSPCSLLVLLKLMHKACLFRTCLV